MKLRVNGEAIRSLRMAIGIQQNALAARVGIKPPTMSQIEHGVHQPRIETASRIARELGVPLAAITYPAPDAEPECEEVAS